MEQCEAAAERTPVDIHVLLSTCGDVQSATVRSAIHLLASIEMCLHDATFQAATLQHICAVACCPLRPVGALPVPRIVATQPWSAQCRQAVAPSPHAKLSCPLLQTHHSPHRAESWLTATFMLTIEEGGGGGAVANAGLQRHVATRISVREQGEHAAVRQTGVLVQALRGGRC